MMSVGFEGVEGVSEAYLVTISDNLRVPHPVPFKVSIPVKPEKLGAKCQPDGAALVAPSAWDSFHSPAQPASQNFLLS